MNLEISNLSSELHINETVTNSTEDSANAIQASSTLQKVYLIIGVFGFISNLYVILVIALYQPMHKQLTNVYIINQSSIDTVVAIFLFFTTIYSDTGVIRQQRNLEEESLCRLWYTKMPLWGMLVSSSYGIVALTFERFLAIVYPIWHKTTYSKNTAMIAATIAGTWLIGPLFNIAYMTPSAMITSEGLCTVYSVWPNKLTQSAVGVFTIFIQYLVPLAFLGIGYIKMALELQGRVGPSEAQGGGSSAGGEVRKNESMVKARSNVIKTLAIVAFFFILCWTWNQVYYLLYHLGYSHVNFTSNFYNFTVIMVFLNCCVNPVVYSLNYAQFRAGVLYVFCRKNFKSKLHISEQSAAYIASISGEQKF